MSCWFIGGVRWISITMMEEEEAEQEQCVPVTEDARDNLKSAEVHQYFLRALSRELPVN